MPFVAAVAEQACQRWRRPLAVTNIPSHDLPDKDGKKSYKIVLYVSTLGILLADNKQLCRREPQTTEYVYCLLGGGLVCTE